MAASMADYELFQIEITRTYGKNEWRDDIRKLFRKSGVEGKHFSLFDKKVLMYFSF
jgi:dynein heavy chain